MMMGFSNLHVRIPTSPIDSVAIVVLDCVVVVVEVERVVDFVGPFFHFFSNKKQKEKVEPTTQKSTKDSLDKKE